MNFEKFRTAAIALLESCQPLKAIELAEATGANYQSAYQWLKKMVAAGDIAKVGKSYAMPDYVPSETVETEPAKVEVIEMRLPRAGMTVKPSVDKFTVDKVDGVVTIVPKNSEPTAGKSSESPRLVSSQLSLLDVSGTEKVGSATIEWLPVEKLYPHPDNPRLIYRDDIIDTIAQSITEKGFKPEYALLVRPFGDGYQIISGHTRHKAAIKADCKMLPCWVKEMGDVAAFMELVLANNQGELSPLEYGIHVLKYVELSAGGRGKKGGLSDYAKTIGKHDNTLRPYRDAAIVINSINLTDIRDVLDKANHVAVIHKAPEQYWQQLTELLIEKEWSVKQTETIVNAIKEVDIPEILHGFLVPEVWAKKVIADATSDNPQGQEKVVMRWVKAALKHLEGDDALPIQMGVWLFDDEGNPYHTTVNPQEQFLERLPSLIDGDKVPSDKKITSISQDVINQINLANSKYEKWKLAQESAEESERQRLARLQAQNELILKYTPIGINAELTTASLDGIGGKLFDAIITDPPYLLSNGGTTVRSGKEVSVDKNFDDSRGTAIAPDEWIGHCVDWIRPGGYLVAFCTQHILWDLKPACDKYGLTYLQTLVWHKENAPPLLTADRFVENYEYIFVAYKPGGDRYFGYEDIKDGDKQKGAVITIPQCGGKERLDWHDTQKPLDLMGLLIKAYVPIDGRVLDPFSGTGTTAVAAKKLKRIAAWIEQDSHFYQKAEKRIEETPFPFIDQELEF